MSKKLYEETNIQDIANAIREKNGTQNTYTTGQMAEAVRAIRTPPSLEELDAVANGDYVPSSGKDGFSNVHVDVPTGGADPVLQEKTATQNGIVLPDTGYDGLSKVTVNVSGGGTASFDNILIGSADPDASIGTPGDVYIRALTNRVDGRAYHKFLTYFYKNSQNVWIKYPDAALPYPRISVRVVTHSVSGSDASINIYVEQTFVTNILYRDVQGPYAHAFSNIGNLFIGYGAGSSVTPDKRTYTGWCIYSPVQSNVKYNEQIISPNSLIQAWNYNTSVDFTIEV